MTADIETTLELSSNDTRQYRVVDLNGLDVLLISDAETDKASCAIDVHVGQLNDGDFAEGIAHFCEHMLFIGTKKYPTENAYDQFLSTHGGSSNAFTDLEHTNYYFDVQASDLEGAMDRFAQCFIAPLFTQNAIDRELQAVDSEHQKNLQQDQWRVHQLSKSTMAPSSHPYSSFGSGNEQSLATENIREKLLKFYEKYYRRSLSLYKLVVLGKESLEDLEAMVQRCFLGLPTEITGDSQHDREDILAEFFSPVEKWQVPQRLHVLPVGQVHSIELQFPMPPQIKHYMSKPTRYLSHLIGHEGEGSLLSLLKQKHYALELYADDSSKSCLSWNIFTVHMDLTDHGLENVDEVVQIFFSYTELLKSKGPQEWVQKELQTVSEMQFRFLSQRNPMDYTCSVAGWMQLYPAQHYLSGPYKVFGWEPDAVAQCLESLNPDNVLWILSSPTFSEKLENPTTEKWYGTKYERVLLDEALQNQLRTAMAEDYPELALPQRNDMIATDFDLLPEALRERVPKEHPQCITLIGSRNDGEKLYSTPRPHMELFYKPDNVYDMPKVNILYHFSSSVANATEHAAISTQIFVDWIQEQVNEYTYLSSMAGLHCEIGVAHDGAGIDLQVSGYSHKAHVLVEKLMTCIMSSLESTTLKEGEKGLFARLVYKLEQQFQSFLVAQPYQHAIYGADQVLEDGNYSIPQKLAALKQLGKDSSVKGCIVEQARRFWKDCRLVGLVHGNVTPDHAKGMTQNIWSTLQTYRSLDEGSQASLSRPFERRVVQLSPGKTYVYRFEEFNPANTNSCTMMVLQCGTLKLEDNAMLAFLHHLIKEPAFNQLRTEEQLGYIVHTSIKTSGDNIKGLLFLIQSDGFDPLHVESRIEEFLSKMREKIESMLAEDFETHIKTVVASFLEKNKNMGEETTRYWHVMMNQSFHFTRLKELVEHVKEVTKEKVLAFFDDKIAMSAPNRRKLCVQVFSKDHIAKMSEGVGDGVELIEDPELFRRSMPLHPLPKSVEMSVAEMPAF